MKISQARWAALPLAAAAACSSFAQSGQVLSPMVVTATRVEQPLSDALSDVTVLDDQALRSGPWSTLGEVLQSLPGVQSVSHGSNFVFIRGAESRMTLVLIDGVRVDRQDGYITGGGAPWQALPVDAVDRIEVLRGAAGSVYGADAVGGVIQIFTRDGREGEHLSASLGLASHNTQSAQFNVAGRSNAWNYALQAGSQRSDGFDSQPGVAHSPADEAWKKQRLSLALGRELSKDHHVGLRLGHSEHGSQYVPWGGGTNIDVRSKLTTAALSWDARWSDRWQSRLSLTQARMNVSETLPKDFQTVGQGLLWNNIVTTEVGTLQMALEHRNDRLEVAADGWGNAAQGGTRRQNSASGGWSHNIGKAWLLQGNIRLDDDSLFGEKLTWRTAIGYRITDGWRLHAGTSTGYRAPTLSQLYDPAYGDRSLAPETSRSSELGILHEKNGQRWQVIMHQARYENLISSRPFTDPVCAFCWYNVASAKTQGVSVSGQWPIAAGRLGFSMDWLDARNEQTGNKLNLRAPRTLSTHWETSVMGWNLRNEWLLKSARFDDAANLKRLPGYGVWNVAGRRDIGKGWSVVMRLENILDKSYEEIKGITTPGRRWFAGLSWSGQ